MAKDVIVIKEIDDNTKTYYIYITSKIKMEVETICLINV